MGANLSRLQLHRACLLRDIFTINYEFTETLILRKVCVQHFSFERLHRWSALTLAIQLFRCSRLCQSIGALLSRGRPLARLAYCRNANATSSMELCLADGSIITVY